MKPLFVLLTAMLVFLAQSTEAVFRPKLPEKPDPPGSKGKVIIIIEDGF